MVECIWVVAPDTLGAMVKTVLPLEGGAAEGTGTEGAGTGTVLRTGGTDGVGEVPVLLAQRLALRFFWIANCSDLDIEFHLAVGMKSGSF